MVEVLLLRHMSVRGTMKSLNDHKPSDELSDDSSGRGCGYCGSNAYVGDPFSGVQAALMVDSRCIKINIQRKPLHISTFTDVQCSPANSCKSEHCG